MKISIIVPVFNAEKYIEECLNSILNQSEKDFELIVINDGSTDKSLDIIKKLGDSRIILINNEKNMGKYSAGPINLGLLKAQGEYLAWISADDFLYNKNSLSKLVSILDTEDVDMVSGAYQIVNTKGERINDIVYDVDILTYDMLRITNYVAASFLFRRKIFEKVGYINEDLVGVDDWDYWIRVSKAGFRIKKIKELLYCWRRHDSNTTGLLQDKCSENVKMILEREKG